MVDDGQTERCALICDEMAKELEGLRTRARRGQYDRRSGREIDYAIKAVRRVGDRIRALKGLAHETAQPAGDGDKVSKAIAIAKELRPLIARSSKSAWRQAMLARLDDLLS